LVPVPVWTTWVSIDDSFPAVSAETTRCGAAASTGRRTPSASMVASTSFGGLYIPPLASVT
jgi:hypothetical protein